MNYIKIADISCSQIKRNKKDLNLPVYSVTNSKGLIIADNYFKKTVHSSELSKYKILEVNDIAYNPVNIKIGSICENDKEKCLVSPLYEIFKIDNTKMLNKYFLYYITSPSGLREVLKNSQGAVRITLKYNNLAKMLVPCPSLEEQAIVIAKIERIRKTINKCEKKLELLNNLVKSRFIEMFGDLKENPNEYDIKYISDLFNVGSSKRVFESEWTDSVVPFYRAREIVKLSKDGYVDNELFITEEMYENYKNKYGVPRENDMMVTGVGTLGICYIVKKDDKFYFKDGNTLWFKNKGLCNVRFIKDQYNTDFVKKQIASNANASTVGTYTITNANNTRVLVPPINLQNEYVAFCKLIDKSKYFGGMVYAI